MRTLVIETATAACSVALLAGDRVIAARHEVVGRGHAERLVPMIAELPDGGRADHVLVDCGPGSFTGIRVGIAAARALALGWAAGLGGFSSTAIVAARAARDGGLPLMVALAGGHGELFVEGFDQPFLTSTDPMASLPPADVLSRRDGRRVVGNAVAALLALEPALPVTDALPRAADAVLLPPALTTLAPRPIYGRAPDAKPMAAKVAP